MEIQFIIHYHQRKMNIYKRAYSIIKNSCLIFLLMSFSLEARNNMSADSVEMSSVKIENMQLLDFLRREVFPLATTHATNKKDVYTYIEVRNDKTLYIYLNIGLTDHLPISRRNEDVVCSIVDGYTVFIKTYSGKAWLVPNGVRKFPVSKALFIVNDDGYNWQLSIVDGEIKIDMFYHD